MTQHTEASKTSHTSAFEPQESRMGSETARESAIREQASQMPKSFRATYFKAASGKASCREAIKAHCCQCMGWDRQEVRVCTDTACPL